MSNILVNTIKDTGNNTLLSSDGSGSVTLGSGFPQNTPAFHARLTNTQTGQTDNTAIKVQINSEVYDTDNCYDNSTNYRFTPTTAGKYYFYAQVMGSEQNFSNSVLNQMFVMIYKNGTKLATSEFAFSNNYARYVTPYVGSVIEMNGTTDYVECYAQADSSNNQPVRFNNNSTQDLTFFGGYRIIGA